MVTQTSVKDPVLDRKRYAVPTVKWWMVPVFRLFEYVNFERNEQKINSTS